MNINEHEVLNIAKKIRFCYPKKKSYWEYYSKITLEDTNKEVAAYIEEHRSQKEYNYRKLTEVDVAQERIDYLEKELAILEKN